MGRHRSRSYSRSRSPVRRKRYDGISDRGRSRRSPEPSGLLVRNISLKARPEDLRVRFEKFGPIKDIYLPKNYYTGDPRGFGFVKFRYPEDAAEAKNHLNRTVLDGREIRIVYAEENRKTPQEMRRTTRVSSRGSHRRRSPSVSPRRRYPSSSRSPSPARHDTRRRGRGADKHNSPGQSRSISRSASPRDDEIYMSRERSPRPRDKYRKRSRYLPHSASPSNPRSNKHSSGHIENGEVGTAYEPNRSPSPMRKNPVSPARSRSKSYSPH